jgi:hypothetical protein
VKSGKRNSKKAYFGKQLKCAIDNREYLGNVMGI